MYDTEAGKSRPRLDGPEDLEETVDPSSDGPLVPVEMNLGSAFAG